MFKRIRDRFSRGLGFTPRNITNRQKNVINPLLDVNVVKPKKTMKGKLNKSKKVKVHFKNNLNINSFNVNSPNIELDKKLHPPKCNTGVEHDLFRYRIGLNKIKNAEYKAVHLAIKQKK